MQQSRYEVTINALRAEKAAVIQQAERFEEIPINERLVRDYRFRHPIPNDLSFYLGSYPDVTDRTIQSRYSISGPLTPSCNEDTLISAADSDAPLKISISCSFISTNIENEFEVSFDRLEGNSGAICRSLRIAEDRTLGTVTSTFSPRGENPYPLFRDATVTLKFIVGDAPPTGSWTEPRENFIFFKDALDRLTIQGNKLFSSTELEMVFGPDYVADDNLNYVNTCMYRLRDALSVDQDARVASLVQEDVFTAGEISFGYQVAYWEYRSGNSSWRVGVGNDAKLVSIGCEIG